MATDSRIVIVRESTTFSSIVGDGATATVTLSSSWPNNNLKVGQSIKITGTFTFNGTYEIASVSSQSEFTFNTTTSGSEFSGSAGGDYSSLEAAELGERADLVSNNENLFIDLYDDFVGGVIETSQINIASANWTTDRDHFLIIRAAITDRGNSWEEGDGVTLKMDGVTFSGSTANGMIHVDNDLDVFLQGFEIDGTSTTDTENTNAFCGVSFSGSTGGGSLLLEDMRIHDVSDHGILARCKGNDTAYQFRNVVVYNADSIGVDFDREDALSDWNNNSYWDHGVVYNSNDEGISVGYDFSNVRLRNVYSGGNFTDDFEIGGTDRIDLANGCASSDTTATTVSGSGNLASIDPDYVFYVPERGDFRPEPIPTDGNPLINAGNQTQWWSNDWLDIYSIYIGLDISWDAYGTDEEIGVYSLERNSSGTGSISTSMSTTDSTSYSTTKSTSASTSATTTKSTTDSTSASTSKSSSASTTKSTSASTTASTSASSSMSSSATTVVSSSYSTTKSTSASTSASTSKSTSASTSASTTASTSASSSTTDSTSASTSKSSSASTTKSTSASTTASTTASTSASMSSSISSSASTSVSTTASSSASTSVTSSATSSVTSSATTSGSTTNSSSLTTTHTVPPGTPGQGESPDLGTADFCREDGSGGVSSELCVHVKFVPKYNDAYHIQHADDQITDGVIGSPICDPTNSNNVLNAGDHQRNLNPIGNAIESYQGFATVQVFKGEVDISETDDGEPLDGYPVSNESQLYEEQPIEKLKQIWITPVNSTKFFRFRFRLRTLEGSSEYVDTFQYVYAVAHDACGNNGAPSDASPARCDNTINTEDQSDPIVPPPGATTMSSTTSTSTSSTSTSSVSSSVSTTASTTKSTSASTMSLSSSASSSDSTSMSSSVSSSATTSASSSASTTKSTSASTISFSTTTTTAPP